MSKLIVEEGGQRRAFKIGQGILTVGSGAEARLQLTSPDVAEIHLEIEVQESGLLVRPRPGVVPAKAHGVPITVEKLLAFGHKLSVGAATIWLESETGAPANVPHAPAPAPRSVVRAKKRRVKHGAPTWVIASGVLTGALVGLLVLQKLLEKSAQHEAGGSRGTINAIRGHIDASQLELAEKKIRLALQGASNQERLELESMKREIEAGYKHVQSVIDNGVGSRWMHTYLENYEKRYLEGKESRPHVVRLFVKRLKEFKERWPKHPRVEWVDRQLTRLRRVDVDAEPTWEDVDWEVRLMVIGKPRNYVEAFKVLESMYGKLDSSNDEFELEARILKLKEEQAEYHKDRLYQAQDEFKKNKDDAKAVWWLVHSIIWIADDDMADEAAEILIKMPDIEGHLLGYDKKYPERLDLVLQNRVIEAWVRKTGFTL